MPLSSSLPLLKPCVHQYRIAIKNHPTQPLDSAPPMLPQTAGLLSGRLERQGWRQRRHRSCYQKLGFPESMYSYRKMSITGRLLPQSL